METDEKERFMQQFYQHADISIKTILKLQRRKYTRATILKSPPIKALLREYAVHAVPHLQKQIIPIEKFLEKFPENQRNAWYQFKLIESHHPLLHSE